MENSAAAIAGYLTAYFDGTSVSSLEVSLDSYKAIDAWVTDMAMKESAFTRLQDIIESAGELERRVEFGEIVITDVAHTVYEQVYGQ